MLHNTLTALSSNFRISNNPILCSTVDLCSPQALTPTSNSRNTVLIAVTTSAAVLVLSIVIIIVCIFKKRKIQQPQSRRQGIFFSNLVPFTLEKSSAIYLTLSFFAAAESNFSQQNGPGTSPLVNTVSGLQSESHQFLEADIIQITNNFARPIGQGGFGTVYHGILNNGTEVAVKLLSRLSDQGAKQFKAEVSCSSKAGVIILLHLNDWIKQNLKHL